MKDTQPSEFCAIQKRELVLLAKVVCCKLPNGVGSASTVNK